MYHKKIILFQSLRSCCPYLHNNKCSHVNAIDFDNIKRCLSSTCPFDKDNISNPPKALKSDEGYETILIECGNNATDEEKNIINLVENHVKIQN